MHLVPRELDKLVISLLGLLAQRRLARGVRLNHAEATALIANNLHELIRDGNFTVKEVKDIGKEMLGQRHVMPSVISSLAEVMVEGTFPSGTFLVAVDNPVCSLDGNLVNALYGSFLPIPSEDLFPELDSVCYEKENLPGAVVTVDGDIVMREGRKRTGLYVTNNGDRPVQIGSHYHMIELNPQLEFDRIRSYGYTLDIAAGTAIRFEPGIPKFVTLVEIGGKRVIRGGNNIAPVNEVVVSYQMTREKYAIMFGPTTGDRVRLGATDLWIKIEHDFTTYGDECAFGGGKTVRDGMGQMSGCSDLESLDTVIKNATIVDWSGIVKADIGIKGGMIVGIGKAGNPDVMDGVHPGMIIRSCTDVIAAEEKIITASAIDTHVHLLCPQQAAEAISSGVTTMFGGGIGPSTGSNATTCTPGVEHMRQMLQACDSLPVNVAITGEGSDSDPLALREQCIAKVTGLKVHEDWHCTYCLLDIHITY